MNEFKVGDFVYHFSVPLHLYEVVRVDKNNIDIKDSKYTYMNYPPKYFFKPKVYAGQTLICKLFKEECVAKTHSYIKGLNLDNLGQVNDFPELLEVEYNDGSSNEFNLNGYEFFVPKFKKGQKITWYNKFNKKDFFVVEVTKDSEMTCYGEYFAGVVLNKNEHYEIGKTCNDWVASQFELGEPPFEPKFKKGDLLVASKNETGVPIRTASCDSYFKNGMEYVDVDYTFVEKAKLLSANIFEKYVEPKIEPIFKPKFKKGDAIKGIGEKETSIRTAICDSYFEDGKEWVDIYYSCGLTNKRLNVNVFEKSNSPKFIPSLKKGDVVRFKDGDNFYILNKDSFMYNGEELVYIPCISTNVRDLVKYVPAK